MKRSPPTVPITESGSSVWCLYVVSSEGQSETLPFQRAWAQDTARRNGWSITREFEGVSSGKDGVRAKVRRMIDDLGALLKAQRPGRLLMIRTDRLGREPLEVASVLAEIRRLGPVIHTRTDGDLALHKASESILPLVQSVVAGLENEARVDKAKAVYARKRAAGLAIGNRRPYGMQIGPDGKDVAIPEAAPVVREAFKMRATGRGYYSIATRLQEIAPPVRLKNGREYVVRWTQNRVLRLLENAAYVGPIVDRPLFVKAQRVRERLGRPHDQDQRNRHPWPLSGSLRCYCGRAMGGMQRDSQDKRRTYRYYACRLHLPGGKVRLVRAEDLEEGFVELLRHLSTSPEAAARWRKRAATTASPKLIERGIQEARKQLAELTRKRDAVWNLFETAKVRGEDVQPRLDTLAQQRREVEATIVRLEEQRVLLNAANRKDRDVEDLLKKAPARFTKAPVAARQAVARSVAAALGGLYVDESGEIAIGSPEDAERQRRRSAAGR